MVSPLSLYQQVNLVESEENILKLIRNEADALRLSTLDLFPPASIGAVVSVRRYSLFRGANFRPSRRLSLYRPRWGLLSTYVRISLSHAACNPGLSMDEAVRVGRTVRNSPPAVV